MPNLRSLYSMNMRSMHTNSRDLNINKPTGVCLSVCQSLCIMSIRLNSRLYLCKIIVYLDIIVLMYVSICLLDWCHVRKSMVMQSWFITYNIKNKIRPIPQPCRRLTSYIVRCCKSMLSVWNLLVPYDKYKFMVSLHPPVRAQYDQFK